MEKRKRFKDPIYGYIDIPIDVVFNIIDTPNFQRLRRIIQTSYSPLYSSAVHNRFVHSIGVYHLGKIVADRLSKEILSKSYGSKNSRISYIFEIACLLHDVGHAPFSHTGEMFYLGKDERPESLHKDLISLVDTNTFSNDIPGEKSKSAAPHEIMSAIVGITAFPNIFQDKWELEFFSRCITGYMYSNPDEEHQLMNCFIELLNSNVIDVDKLDYLIRDAYTTGFDTINIDFVRLLDALTIIKSGNKYEIAFNKTAISVIENVIYAHDSERKWIQSHPSVLYEMYILNHVMMLVDENIMEPGKTVFCKESLLQDGVKLRDGTRIRLLCDDDIIYHMKNSVSDVLCDEFFDRRLRRHPVWKSETEYKSLFIGNITGGKYLDNFENAMTAISDFLASGSNDCIINDSLINAVQEELKKLDNVELDEETKLIQKENKNLVLKTAKCLKEYAESKNIEFDFIIIKASQFRSGFGKSDFSNINICLSDKEESINIAKVGENLSSLLPKEKKRDDFFYLFYKRNENEDVLDSYELCELLIKELGFRKLQKQKI